MGSKNALKKLKKLKKTTVKVQSASLAQLQKLSGQHSSGTSKQSSSFVSEIQQVSREAMVSAAKELTAPLNPVMSWFQGESGVSFTSTASVTGIQSMTEVQNAGKSILHLPLKSPPCRKCPAKENGICRCAAKNFKAA